MRILHIYIVLSTAWILKIVFVHHQVIKTHFLYWTHKELRQLLCMCNELIKIKQHVLWQQYNVQWFLTKRLYRPRVFDTKEYKSEIYSIHITHDSILDNFGVFKKICVRNCPSRVSTCRDLRIKSHFFLIFICFQIEV